MQGHGPLLGIRFQAVKVLAVLILFGAHVSSGQNARRGRALYEGCTACHGNQAQGNMTLKAPAIAGLPHWYLKTQLQNFKSGIRGAHADDSAGLLMRPMAKTLATDKDVDDVVAHISGLEPQNTPPTFSGDAAAGKTAYLVCTTCHGDKGQGNKLLKSPPIHQMDDWYMLTQLRHFKAGVRGADLRDTPGMQMRGMTMTLADEQAMKNVIAYIKTLTGDDKE